MSASAPPAAKFLRAWNATRGRLVASRVAVARDAASRAAGLLGRDGLAEGEGLWIVQSPWARLVPCPTIHTLFMRFPIDAVFLDGGLRAARVLENLAPWRLSPWVPEAASVLELSGGALGGALRPGDRLEMRPA